MNHFNIESVVSNISKEIIVQWLMDITLIMPFVIPLAIDNFRCTILAVEVPLLLISHISFGNIRVVRMKITDGLVINAFKTTN